MQIIGKQIEPPPLTLIRKAIIQKYQALPLILQYIIR